MKSNHKLLIFALLLLLLGTATALHAQNPVQVTQPQWFLKYIKQGPYTTATLPGASTCVGCLVYNGDIHNYEYSNGSVWSAFSGTGGSAVDSIYQHGDSLFYLTPNAAVYVGKWITQADSTTIFVTPMQLSDTATALRLSWYDSLNAYTWERSLDALNGSLLTRDHTIDIGGHDFTFTNFGQFYIDNPAFDGGTVGINVDDNTVIFYRDYPDNTEYLVDNFGFYYNKGDHTLNHIINNVSTGIYLDVADGVHITGKVGPAKVYLGAEHSGDTPDSIPVYDKTDRNLIVKGAANKLSVGNADSLGHQAASYYIPHVATIAELEWFTGDWPTVIVDDKLMGGIFFFSDTLSVFDNGTTFQASGIGYGGWIRQFDKSYGCLPEWWGAVGNGIHFDDTALKAAIAYDSINHVSVYLTLGKNYLLNDSIYIPAGVNIISSGKWQVSNRTNQSNLPQVSVPSGFSKNIFSFSATAYGSSVTGLWINASNAIAGNAIYMAAGDTSIGRSKIRLSNLYISNSASDGINAIGVSSEVFSNVWVDGARNIGFNLQGSDVFMSFCFGSFSAVNNFYWQGGSGGGNILQSQFWGCQGLYGILIEGQNISFVQCQSDLNQYSSLRIRKKQQLRNANRYSIYWGKVLQ